MTDNRPIRLTAVEALTLLPDGAGPVHTFLAGIGASHERYAIEITIRTGRDWQIAGAVSRGLDHGLVIYTASRDILFIETDRARVEALVAERTERRLQAAE